MNSQPVQIGLSNRANLIKRGRRLEYFTITYNSLEGLIALVAGLMAGSIALVAITRWLKEKGSAGHKEWRADG